MRVRPIRRSTAVPRRVSGAHRPRTGGARPEEAFRRPRHSGGPTQDRALYTCACGYRFEAPVSASVRCPTCGAEQAW